ncbi:predicted protein [Histoplasma mississippiense (nom. inval.)]|uniref:predicted protein n=1 Tax=Ajellomyces capsulatus (strain NAm1 / WU24) TaxID=2059318 RepID=UPI000157B7D7|nr:predicted protein [Histoplasma mississippiense (nom. inval.)]EDN03695.1 predicted protein [Histoplasma mississippiense (nom. inval.)]
MPTSTITSLCLLDSGGSENSLEDLALSSSGKPTQVKFNIYIGVKGYRHILIFVSRFRFFLLNVIPLKTEAKDEA